MSGNVTELAAWRRWQVLPEGTRDRIVANVFCTGCGVTSFAPGWTIKRIGSGLILEGTCSSCGRSVARVIEEA